MGWAALALRRGLYAVRLLNCIPSSGQIGQGWAALALRRGLYAVRWLNCIPSSGEIGQGWATLALRGVPGSPGSEETVQRALQAAGHRHLPGEGQDRAVGRRDRPTIRPKCQPGVLIYTLDVFLTVKHGWNLSENEFLPEIAFVLLNMRLSYSEKEWSLLNCSFNYSEGTIDSQFECGISTINTRKTTIS